MKLEQEQMQRKKLEQLIRLQEAKRQNIAQQTHEEKRVRATSAPLKRYNTPSIPSSNGWMSHTVTPTEFDDSLTDAQEASPLKSSCCTEVLSPGYTSHSLLKRSERTGNFWILLSRCNLRSSSSRLCTPSREPRQPHTETKLPQVQQALLQAPTLQHALGQTHTTQRQAANPLAATSGQQAR